MGSLSDYSESKLLNHVLGNTAYTPAATVYIGLSTADPLDDASGIAEPAGGSYAREAITFAAAGSRSIAQTGDVTFDQATGAWGTIGYWFICDHLSNTTWGTNVNLLAHGSLQTPKQVVAGNTPSIASGQVTVSFNAGGIITNLANKLLDLMFRNQAYAQPTIYACLSTADPTDTCTGITEPSSAGAYNRIATTTLTGFTSVTTAGVGKNASAISWASPTTSWGVIGWVVLASTSAVNSSNDGLFYATVSTQTPSSGDTVRINATALEITLT